MSSDTCKSSREVPPAFSRPLLPVVVALMAGLASPAWGLRLPEKWLAPALVLIWALLVILWLARRRLRLLPLAFFWLLGVAFYQQALQPVFPLHDLVNLPQEQGVIIQGRLNRPSKMSPERVQLFMSAQAWLSPQGWRPATGRLLVSAPPLEPPPVGTGLVVRGRLRVPGELHNPGAYDRLRSLAMDGIFRDMRLQGDGDLVFLASGASYPLGERLRGGIRQLLKPLPPELRAIYLSMLLGDQGEVTPEMRLSLARSGTSHLLVVNGLHLGMVAAVVFFCASWLLRRSAWLLLRLNVMKTATLLAGTAVLGYAWVAGGSPSTQRAEVMVLAYLVLVFLGRPRELWSALALAALIILSLTPLRLFSISFQLSFAAVAFLIYLMPRILAFGAASGADFRPGPGTRLLTWLKEWGGASAVATLATAPLVAAYFQVVSLLGIIVNLVAIPLFLLLALPLGEAAVFAQAIHLPSLARALLFLGQFPLWLGWQAITLGALLPGSALIAPIPTWLQIALYYLALILVFAPRRSFWTWGGAGLAAAALLLSAAWPFMGPGSGLEVTCLDTYGGLSAMVVSPEGQRLALSAPAPSWPGRASGGPGALPAYCHWRQFRSLEQVLAFTLSQDNAGELLPLAQQFNVGEYWYGRRGWRGPALWDLWNYLGDRGRLPRPLEPSRAGPRPPASLGSAELQYLKLGPDEGSALAVTCRGRRVLIVPPGRRDFSSGDAVSIQAIPARPDLLILPAVLARAPESEPWLDHLQPGLLVIYGGAVRPADYQRLARFPCHLTKDGAVSVFLEPDAVRVRQWGTAWTKITSPPRIIN